MVHRALELSLDVAAPVASVPISGSQVLTGMRVEHQRRSLKTAEAVVTSVVEWDVA